MDLSNLSEKELLEMKELTSKNLSNIEAELEQRDKIKNELVRKIVQIKDACYYIRSYTSSKETKIGSYYLADGFVYNPEYHFFEDMISHTLGAYLFENPESYKIITKEEYMKIKKAGYKDYYDNCTPKLRDEYYESLTKEYEP